MKGLLKSFVYAFNGIRFAVFNERNFRIHLTAVFFVTYFSVLYGLTEMQYSVLFILFGVVLAAELFNTAIEKSLDLKPERINEYTRIAKDTAAGAVLVLSIVAVIVAVTLFSDAGKLLNALSSVCSLPHLPILAAAGILSIYFVFFFGNKR